MKVNPVERNDILKQDEDYFAKSLLMVISCEDYFASHTVENSGVVAGRCCHVVAKVDEFFDKLARERTWVQFS